MRLPFHKYLGPGNSLNEGTPVNAADSIAHDHDFSYEQDVSRNNIRSADSDAIRLFTDNFVSNLNNPWESIPSAIGAIGLTAKKYFEDTFGQVYPAPDASR